MSAVTFDALRLVETLEQAKLPREQARAIVEVVRESRETTLAEQSSIAQSASERAVVELDTKTAQAVAELDVKTTQAIATLDAKTTQAIAELDTKTTQAITEIRGDIKLLKWMFGTLLTIGLTALAGIASLIVMAVNAFS